MFFTTFMVLRALVAFVTRVAAGFWADALLDVLAFGVIFFAILIHLPLCSLMTCASCSSRGPAVGDARHRIERVVGHLFGGDGRHRSRCDGRHIGAGLTSARGG